MAHFSLYRKFRPLSFDKVIGQNHIVRTLINQVKNDSVGHAYIFTGTRGTGKTSCAKIFARAVNCQSPINGSPCYKCEKCTELASVNCIDIIELDAASNNGVNDIRELCDSAQYPPSVGRYKVFIIDEVHMLTTAAFNALLKTLEEPPSHIIFILATTDTQKVPATILSRCLRFDFRLVSRAELVKLLSSTFDDMNQKYEVAALEQIAINAEGSVRDCWSIADICIAFTDGKLHLKDVVEVLGVSDFETNCRLAKAILERNTADLIFTLEESQKKGIDALTLSKSLSTFFCDGMGIKNVDEYMGAFTDFQKNSVIELFKNYDNYRLARILDIISGIESVLRFSNQPRIILEATLVKASEISTDLTLDGVLSRLKEAESKLLHIMENGIMINDTSAKLQNELVLNDDSSLQNTALLTPIDDAQPAFSEKEDDNQEFACQMYENMLNFLEQNNHPSFRLNGYKKEKNVKLYDKTLVLYPKNLALIGLMTQPDEVNKLNSALQAFQGPGYIFEVREQVEVSEKKISEEKRAKIETLFGKLKNQL